MNLSQFGEVQHSRIIKGEPSSIAQLQDGNGGHGFGDGSPVVGCVGVTGAMDVAARFAEPDLRWRFLGMDDRDPAPDDTVLCEGGVEASTQSVWLNGG